MGYLDIHTPSMPFDEPDTVHLEMSFTTQISSINQRVNEETN